MVHSSSSEKCTERHTRGLPTDIQTDIEIRLVSAPSVISGYFTFISNVQTKFYLYRRLAKLSNQFGNWPFLIDLSNELAFLFLVNFPKFKKPVSIYVRFFLYC